MGQILALHPSREPVEPIVGGEGADAVADEVGDETLLVEKLGSLKSILDKPATKEMASYTASHGQVDG